MVLLAFPVLLGERVDIRQRPVGARAAGDAIGQMLPRLHIKGVKGAFMNIGKNSPEMVRGNNKDFDATVNWASTKASVDELEAAYATITARVAATARVVQPRPKLRLGQLTFPNVMALLQEMLNTPSQGAHEQYVTSALLEAALGQEGSARRVETKGLSASDTSARTAGDVEVYERGRLQEGVEVTANPWDQKVEKAKEAIEEYGLPRSHIVAHVEGKNSYEELRGLVGDKDISIVDVRVVAALLTALLDRGGRELALLRLYDLLDHHLPDPATVNAYVELLHERGLTE